MFEKKNNITTWCFSLDEHVLSLQLSISTHFISRKINCLKITYVKFGEKSRNKIRTQIIVHYCSSVVTQ